MARRSRTTFQKHFKEQARQQKQREKAARRLEAKQRRAATASGSDDTVTDADGMSPGSQPSPAPEAPEPGRDV
jgi:hypothetical protein